VTEESRDTQKEELAESEVKPPMPDVPAEANPPPFPPSESKPEPAPASPRAQMKMAGEIESGGTPYNYNGTLEENHASGNPQLPAAGGFSLTNVTALTALGALILISVVGWRIMETVSVKIDGVNSNVERLTDRLLLESRLAKRTGRAVVRAELQKSLRSLEYLITTADPLVKAEAIKLKNEIREVLALLGYGVAQEMIDIESQAEATPEPATEPEPAAEPESSAELEPADTSDPAAGIEAPLEEGGEPDLQKNMEQEQSEATQKESSQPLL